MFKKGVKNFINGILLKCCIVYRFVQLKSNYKPFSINLYHETSGLIPFINQSRN